MLSARFCLSANSARRDASLVVLRSCSDWSSSCRRSAWHWRSAASARHISRVVRCWSAWDWSWRCRSSDLLCARASSACRPSTTSLGSHSFSRVASDCESCRTVRWAWCRSDRRVSSSPWRCPHRPCCCSSSCTRAWASAATAPAARKASMLGQASSCCSSSAIRWRPLLSSVWRAPISSSLDRSSSTATLSLRRWFSSTSRSVDSCSSAQDCSCS
mmetsp:Transcript_108371/g.187195  ORF Transcript_108371/g.187195 Transcript_108371/m.187195 type:complete len:216 (-) Transcript_108371:889-1536(-)